MKRLTIIGVVLTMVLGMALSASAAKLPPEEQLYIQVSALGALDYFYDHKLHGLSNAGVRTEYVGR